MSSPLRVVSFGLGPIGMAAARLALQKKSIQLVGAIDVDPAKIGKDLGELLELPKPTGVKVEGDAEAALKRLDNGTGEGSAQPSDLETPVDLITKETLMEASR